MRFGEILAQTLGVLAGTLNGIFMGIKDRLSRYQKSNSDCSIVAASFSPVSYLDRINKLCEELWQEPSERYVIILWWGLDGLKLNKDGTTEWISRKVKTSCSTIPQNAVTPVPGDVFLPFNLWAVQNSNCSHVDSIANNFCQYQNIVQSTNALYELQQMQQLKTNISMLKLAALQAEQNRATINSIDELKWTRFMRSGGL